MEIDGLSVICAGLGIVEEDDYGNRIGYSKGEYCLDNLKDLLRFLRRDDPQTRDVFKHVCKWKIVAKDLIPIIEYCQDDRNLVLNSVKILVFLTMPIEPTSSDIAQQIEYLWGLKSSIVCGDVVAVIVTLLESPLENLDCGTFSEEDWKLVQLVITFFRNVLAIQEISLQQKADGSASQLVLLRDKFLEVLFRENVMDIILVITQHAGGSGSHLHQDKLLFLETFYFIFKGQDPEIIAKAPENSDKEIIETVASVNSLKSIMEEERRKLSRLQNMNRHSQFSGTFTRQNLDGSKLILKGKPSLASCNNLLKPPKVCRGPIKKIAWDNGRLTTKNIKLLQLLHDFTNQFLSGGYNALMQLVHEDIEKEHHSIQNSDIVVFFQVAQFAISFQYHKFSTSKVQSIEADADELQTEHSDSTTFQGNICGPIAETMNEAMFQLVIMKWRCAVEGLKETSDFKFLSAAGSLMKDMICMLDLVLKLLPEDSKEPQTARILLYKLFYDQTDQGMTQFLLNLLKSFDTHKQPKSDLADLVETIFKVVQLMENLQGRGTLRVSKKSRGRKGNSANNKDNKQSENQDAGNKTAITHNEQSRDTNVGENADLSKTGSDSKKEISITAQANEPELLDSNAGNQEAGNKTAITHNEQSTDTNVGENTDLSKTGSDSKEEISITAQADEPELIDSNTGNQEAENKTAITHNEQSTDTNVGENADLSKIGSDYKEEITITAQADESELLDSNTGNFQDTRLQREDKRLDDAYSTADSSSDEQLNTTAEVDLKVSSLVSTFANNSIIQKLCWLLKFYKSNSTNTNHYIICMLRKITEDLGLSPMLYQLSLLVTFYDILSEQKSSPCKEHANIVDFLSNLVRKMLRKMKKQPLLFVEVLFWKTRKECHYINAEYLLLELGYWMKKSRNEEMAGDESGSRTHRSIADALGEDEADVVVPDEFRYHVEAKSDKVENGLESTSDGEIAGKELNHDEQSMIGKSKRVPKRKRLVLDAALESKIKDLYEKFKEERNCSRLIVENLDTDLKVSPAQVSNKLRQMGLNVSQRKRKKNEDEDSSTISNQLAGESRGVERNSPLNSNGLEASSLSQSLNTRKRVLPFNKDQEVMIRALYEQFKDQKRCSYMIANALDADNKITSTQVSRKLKQLGLSVSRQKKSKVGSSDGYHNDFLTEKASQSDDETLFSLINRKKRKHLAKSTGQLKSITTEKSDEAIEGFTQREASNQESRFEPVEVGEVSLDEVGLNDSAEVQGKGAEPGNIMDDLIQHTIDDDFVDSEDEMVSSAYRVRAPTGRKLRMMVDLEDEE